VSDHHLLVAVENLLHSAGISKLTALAVGVWSQPILRRFPVDALRTFWTEYSPLPILLGFLSLSDNLQRNLWSSQRINHARPTRLLLIANLVFC
jgi:hypothetical protein